MALALLFVTLLVPHSTSAQDIQGSVQLYSDDGCSDPTGMPISLGAKVCLETNEATAIAIVSLPSCTNGSPLLFISDLDRCQTPSFYPIISSDTVGECLFFTTGSGIDSAEFICNADDATAVTSQATVPTIAPASSVEWTQTMISSSQPTDSPAVSTNSAVATTDGMLGATPAAGSPSGQSADTSSGLSLNNKIALGCGIGIGLPALILAFLNWRKRHPEPPPPYSLHDLGN